MGACLAAIAPAKRGGNRRHVVVREVVNGLMYILSTGVSGGRSPGPAAALDALRLFRPMGLLCMSIDLTTGALCAVPPSRLARGEPDRRDHRQPERQERGQKGPPIDPNGDQGRQKDQGQEAPHPRRYAGLADARDRPRRRRPGPRRRRAADGELVRLVSVPDQALCRRRLPGTGVPERGETDFRRASMSRSSSDRIKPQASSHCPSAGSSNAPSLGSAAADDWPKTGNVSTTRLSPSCASPPSASCCENYAIPHDVLGDKL